MTPPFQKRKFGSLLESGGVMGEVFCVWGGMNLLQRAAIALVLWVGSDSDITPYTSAEIPPAGAPSGFDSAAFFGFITCFLISVPLRSE